ncbi:MAG: relaxase/mobilization nuclease domain-containing protein [Pseudomonadota bacterium]
MILKGSQRSGGNALAAHLMNEHDNDHITLFELRGFISNDLKGAFQEIHAVSKGTRCQQYLFSLSLNPPQNETASEPDFVAAVDRAEEALGLGEQPRAIVFHEKNGRRHAHAVWSRIDVETMTAVNLPHFKLRLNSLAKELYLDHGWELPDGLKAGGGKSPLNFTLDEWQQAKRLDLDPREIKQSFQEAWGRSDSLAAFKNALEERGYFLAKGDRRGFVALDTNGEVFSVARYTGVKTKEVSAKLGDPSRLKSVDQVRSDIRNKLSDQLEGFIDQVCAKHQAEMQPFQKARAEMVKSHRAERKTLKAGQKQRWNQETRTRSARLNKGLKGLWQTLSGAASKIKAENIEDALACLKRDQEQRDAMVAAQLRERQQLQKQIEKQRRKQAQERRMLDREIASAMRFDPDTHHSQSRAQSRAPTYRGPTP